MPKHRIVVMVSVAKANHHDNFDFVSFKLISVAEGIFKFLKNVAKIKRK